MKNIDLPRIHSEIEQFIQDRDWDQFHSVKNLSMALNVESSELLEIFQWMAEKDSNHAGEDPKLKTKIEDEVADIFFYLLRIVSKTNIDLEQAILNKIQKNIQKYPADLVKGSSKKYTEY